MKYLSILLFVVFVSTVCFADTLSVTKDQFQNLSEVDKVLKEKYAQYKGFNGSAEELEVYGISGASFMKEVEKMKPIDEINNDKEILKTEEELVNKRIRKLAIDSLKAEGVVFKKLEDVL